jgi:hypothetical protein
MSERAARFTATLRRVGVNLLVDVPPRVSQRFGRRGNVPVQATLGGKAFPQTLVPVGGGRHVLYVNVPMLRAAGKGEGDRVAVAVAADPRSRMPRMHPALGKALRAVPVKKAEFEGLTPSHRKEILRYLWNLKSEEAVERNVDRLMRRMAGIGR